MTPAYTIGVWAGNAQGQGVPGLTGARTTGPVMFEILNLLPQEADWFPGQSNGNSAGGRFAADWFQEPDGSLDGAVFRVAHRRSDATIWWHLDQAFIGETKFIHELRLAPEKGKHTLTVVDDEGNTASVGFTID